MEHTEIQYIIIYGGDWNICICKNTEELKNKIIEYYEKYSEFIKKLFIQKYFTKKYVKKHNVDEVIKTTIEIGSELKSIIGFDHIIIKIIEIDGNFHIHE